MLVSMVVAVRSLKGGTLPPSTGKAMHAVFVNWVKLANPSLSAALHAQTSDKPFTVSNLLTRSEANPVISSGITRAGDLILTPSQLYWFRVTSLEDSLSRFLVEILAGSTAPALPSVLGREFEVVYITIDPHKHQWAASETYSNLLNLMESASDLKPVSLGKTFKAKLLFVSPTTFKSNGRALPLPLPLQTFSSLRKRWNAFSGHLIDPGFAEWVEGNVSISSYELKSELVWLEGSAGGARLVGFRGWCEYISFSPDDEYNFLFDLWLFRTLSDRVCKAPQF